MKEIITTGIEVNYHRQRRWLDILALEGALFGLVVIFYFSAFANRFILFCTTEVMYLDLMISTDAQNRIYKIRRAHHTHYPDFPNNGLLGARIGWALLF